MAMPDVQYPINTYGWLKKAVSLWADRDDGEFVDQIPNFINFAEKEIYRNLRIPPLEKELYLDIKDGVAFIPPDYLEAQWMMRAKDGLIFRVTSLEEVDWLKRNNSINPTNWNQGEVVFARLGSRFIFYPLIDADTPVYPDDGSPEIPAENAVILSYYADPPEFWEDSDTSAILTIAPELLLYFSLRHASLFVQDDNAVQKWSALGKAILDEVVEQSKKAEYSGSPLVIPNTISRLNSSREIYGIRRFR
jgi:hypothetical protein